MNEMLVEIGVDHLPPVDEQPTGYAKAFYRMVASADQLVYEDTKLSSLSAVARLIALKS